MVSFHVSEVLINDQAILAESLDWLNHDRLQTHVDRDKANFFEVLGECSIIAGNEFDSLICGFVVEAVCCVGFFEFFLIK
jgi:hypothetical protein